MAAPLLEACDLKLQAGSRVLVEQLSFCIRPGEVWCMLGRNGAGKSTFLHTAVGLRRSQGGSLRLSGKPLQDWSTGAAARERAFLPQSFHDPFSASVLETVLVGRHPHLSRWQWESDEDRDQASVALAAVDLAGFEARDVLTLSGGERQRVALAALLVQDAPLLLLDEPVAHLDLHHQLMVLGHLAKLAREFGKGVLFTAHDLNMAARYADHAVLLSAGPAPQQGRTDEVLTEAALFEAFGHRVSRIHAAGHTLFVAE